MFKFRKSANVSYILFLVMIFGIGLPMFFLNYSAKDALNTKDMLQEAAYTGALAGTYALDVKGFENNTYGSGKDDENNQLVAYMRQVSARVRKGPKITDKDCLGGSISGVRNYTSGTTTDLASVEIVKAVEAFLQENLTLDSNGTNRPTYSIPGTRTLDESLYSISMLFTRENITGGNDESLSKYNTVTVTVSLKYKPIIMKSVLGEEPIPIYGTAKAKTQTIF